MYAGVHCFIFLQSLGAVRRLDTPEAWRARERVTENKNNASFELDVQIGRGKIGHAAHMLTGSARMSLHEQNTC